MSLVAVSPFGLWDYALHAVTTTTDLIDGADEKTAYVVQAPKAGTIDRVCFRTGTVTTGETVDVRVETVATTGLPSGTLWATNTNASKVIGNADDDTWFETTLTAGATVAKGDWFAVVVAMPGSTSGSIAITRGSPTIGLRPYCAHFVAAAWIRRASAPIGAVRYSDGTYPAIPGVLPYGVNSGSQVFRSSTNPDERGNKITVPFACKVTGAWLSGETFVGDFTLKLYDISNNVLSDIAVEGNMHADVIAAQMGDLVMFDNEVTLAAGDVVRLTMLATEGTDTVLYAAAIPSGLAAASPGGGQMVYTTRNDGGAWTDNSAKLGMIGLIVSALDTGGSSGTTQGNLGTVLRGVAH